MARYRTLTKTFIAPHLLEEGTAFTIDNSWEPGPHVEPLDEEAEAAFEAYNQAKPGRMLEPIMQLPTTIDSIDAVIPEAADLSIDFASAQIEKAKPGLSDGGKAEKLK